MLELTYIATGLVMAFGAVVSYGRFHDAMHPAIVVAPPLGFVYAVWPMLLNADGQMVFLFSEDDLTYVAQLYLGAVTMLYIGLLSRRSVHKAQISARTPLNLNLFAVTLSPRTAARVRGLAVVLGILAFAAYVSSIANVGGFVDAYSRVKGGGRASSGYIGEAVLLSYPAILLLAVSVQSRGRIFARDIVLAVLFATPHLMTGTFGGRRGPLFLVLAVLFLSYFLAKGKKPSIGKILVGLALIGCSILVVQSQRQHLYIGSGGSFDFSRVVDIVNPDDTLEDNDYVAGASTVITVRTFEDFYWGYRYFVTIFIRPIPRQIWPTKYEDVGADWITQFDQGEGGQRFLQAVGFRPPTGSAVGFIADIYHEFALGVLVVVYLFGRFLVFLWAKHRSKGGLWTVLFIEAMVLCVYLPTQSFSAWFHRFLFMSVISTLVWKFFIEKRSRQSEREALARQSSNSIR